MPEVKKFGFVPVASLITPVPPKEIAKDYQTELLHMGGEFLTSSQIHENIPLFFFVLTGGTEQAVFNLWQKRKEKFGREPVVLLAHPGNNSLPASLEILAKVQQDGGKGKIIYLDSHTNKEFYLELESTVKHLGVFHQLRKSKIGLVGKPSDWLIASMPEFETINKIWGPEIIEISIDELKSEISLITENEIEETHHFFTSNASGIKEPGKKDLKNVVKVYAALHKLVKKYELNSVSVRCFDLVTDLETTGCFALAKLNDEGIIAGCEGDLVSTIGMLWANLLTEQIIWMANPAQIDEQNNSIKLAHCTVPMSMVDNYKLRSHFESGLGVGIQGELSKGKATIFRLGGKKVDQVWISSAEIMESSAEENLCRTQVRVKLHGNFKASDLLNEPLGNHMLLMRGTYAKEMSDWFDTFIA